LLEEVAPKWQSALRVRRGGARRRAAGAGPKQRLVFTDRLLVTLVHLRLGLPHTALAELYGVDRSTVPDRPGVRLRALEDLFAYSDTEGMDLRIDGTEVQVRRPRAGRPGRKAFVSGKKKQNTIKTPSTPARSATPRAAPSSAESCAPAGCMIRPPCGLRASPSCSSNTRV
jgi:hypothetical protein